VHLGEYPTDAALPSVAMSYWGIEGQSNCRLSCNFSPGPATRGKLWTGGRDTGLVLCRGAGTGGTQRMTAGLGAAAALITTAAARADDRAYLTDLQSRGVGTGIMHQPQLVVLGHIMWDWIRGGMSPADAAQLPRGRVRVRGRDRHRRAALTMPRHTALSAALSASMATMKFEVGQRVICRPNKEVPYMVGYYGHVKRIELGEEFDMVVVSLIGRVGGPVEEERIGTGESLWHFLEEELEHAD
jgi:hypothetical protein